MGEIKQLILGLPYCRTFDRSDFIVAPCNISAVRWLDRYPNWGSHALLIHGPKGCGKTHLAYTFSDIRLDGKNLSDISLPECSRIVIENIDQVTDERALFHLFNWTKEKDIGMLMTARQIPHFVLPDLASRIMMCQKVPILPPDDELILAVLAKAFAERRVVVEQSVLEYAARYTERTFEAIQNLIDGADKLSLSQNRRITIPIVKQVLADLRLVRFQEDEAEQNWREPTFFD